MKFYPNSVVRKVRKKRKEGISIKGLEKKFKIPSTTISRWVRDIRSENRVFQKAREFEEKNKSQFNYLVENLSINNDTAKILTSLLYWCEGSKYPSSNFLAFSNSDYMLVRTFLDLLRTAFTIDERKIKIHLQLHTIHNKDLVIKFWSNLLNIPKSQFYKPTITSPTKNMKRQNYIGTCTIKYFDVKMLLQIIGIFEAFSENLERYPRG